MKAWRTGVLPYPHEKRMIVFAGTRKLAVSDTAWVLTNGRAPWGEIYAAAKVERAEEFDAAWGDPRIKTRTLYSGTEVRKAVARQRKKKS